MKITEKTYSAQFLSNGSLFAAGIFIPIVLGKEFEVSTFEIGFVVTGYATAVFLASIFGGRAADVQGRRRFLRIGFIIAMIASFLQIFASNITFLFLVRILLGAAAGIIQSILVAYFMYETQGKIGKFSSLGALGWGFGSLMAGIIGDYILVFTFSAGLMTFAAVIIFTLPVTKEVTHIVPLFPKEVFKKNFSIYISVLIRHTGASLVWVTYPLFLMDILHADALAVGIVYTTNATSQFLIMRRLDPYRSSHLIKAGFGLSALTFLLFSVTQTIYEIIPLQIILAFAWASLYVGSLKYVIERNPEKATSTGWLQGMISISGIIGPAIGGTLNVLVGYRWTMIAAMALAIIGLLVFILIKDKILNGNPQ